MRLSGAIGASLLAAAVLGAAGCRAVQDLRAIKAPTARVTGVEVLQQTAEGACLRVRVEMDNPNDQPLPVVVSDYQMVLAGAGQFAFADRPKRTLPARGRQTLDMVAAFDTGGADLAGRAYRVSGWLSYEPPGQLRRMLTDSKVPLPRVRLDAAGQLP